MGEDSADAGGIGEWLDRYLQPESVADAPGADPLDFAALQRREIGLLLIRVKGEDPEGAHALLRRVVDLATGRGAVVSDIVSTLVIAGFGIHGRDSAPGEKARELGAVLVEQFEEKVAGLVWFGESLVGTYGGEGRMTFGPFSLELAEQLGALLDVGWGEVEEVI